MLVHHATFWYLCLFEVDFHLKLECLSGRLNIGNQSSLLTTFYISFFISMPQVIIYLILFSLCLGVSVRYFPCTDRHYCGLQSGSARVPRWPPDGVFPEPLLPLWHREVSASMAASLIDFRERDSRRAHVNAPIFVNIVKCPLARGWIHIPMVDKLVLWFC